MKYQNGTDCPLVRGSQYHSRLGVILYSQWMSVFFFCLLVLVRAQGNQGPPGPRGLLGPQGLTGRDGRDGLTGRDGKDGEKGVKGDPGMMGPHGIQGEQGNMYTTMTAHSVHGYVLLLACLCYVLLVNNCA